MKNEKTPARLRDFQIDSSNSSSATDSAGRPGRLEDLWATWENDAGEEIDLSKPVTASRAPLPKRQNPSTPEVQTPKVLEGQAVSEASLLTSDQSWASALALEERRMERNGTVDCASHFQKPEMLRARTKEFLLSLQKLFRQEIELFNEARLSPAHHIHIYKINNTEADFLLYRNRHKLMVSGARAGKILFAFNQYMGAVYSPSQGAAIEIDAVWGAFDQLHWTFKGERAHTADLVRYFVTEFVKQSFR
jgi:hypothetical protein